MSDKLLLLGLVIAFGGAVSLAFGYAAHRHDIVLKQWPATKAKIVASEIIKTTQGRMRAPAHSRLPRPEPDFNLVDVWALDVEYEYTLDGRRRTGYRATSNLLVEDIRKGTSGPSQHMQALAAQIPKGAQVLVHYDPGDPGESYLLYIDSPGVMPLFRTGTALIILGLTMVFASRVIFTIRSGAH